MEMRQASLNPKYPLKASANRRYLDQNDVPFLLQGDAPWSLFVGSDWVFVAEDAAKNAPLPGT